MTERLQVVGAVVIPVLIMAVLWGAAVAWPPPSPIRDFIPFDECVKDGIGPNPGQWC
jgi:hypothetical protein